jgi:hypothetical protein
MTKPKYLFNISPFANLRYRGLRNFRKGDIRAFRLRYLLAKLTQAIDSRAYGMTGSHGALPNYIEGKNDVEHILPEMPSASAIAEFGEVDIQPDLPQRLGNLTLLEKTINQLLGNKPYSEKCKVYPNSSFLLVKCQASRPSFGIGLVAFYRSRGGLADRLDRNV